MDDLHCADKVREYWKTTQTYPGISTLEEGAWWVIVWTETDADEAARWYPPKITSVCIDGVRKRSSGLVNADANVEFRYTWFHELPREGESPPRTFTSARLKRWGKTPSTQGRRISYVRSTPALTLESESVVRMTPEERQRIDGRFAKWKAQDVESETPGTGAAEELRVRPEPQQVVSNAKPPRRPGAPRRSARRSDR